MSLPICHFRFSTFVLDTLKFKMKGRYGHWQCSQYLVLNPTCDRDVSSVRLILGLHRSNERQVNFLVEESRCSLGNCCEEILTG